MGTELSIADRLETMSPTTAFSVRGVSKVFTSPNGSPFDALRDVTLDIHAGRFVSLIGPSGCGKSTLLHLLAGLHQPTEGSIAFQGQTLTGVNTAAGYMTQKDTLLPWSTVEENVALALRLRRMGDRRSRTDQVRRLLAAVGLEGFETHYPAQLSGGMRKRVQLARSLVYDPDVLLMDEPFAAVDAQRRLSLQSQLLDTWSTTGQTVVLVTHDLDEALLLSDEIYVMAAGPGRVDRHITVPFDRPRDLIELRASAEFGTLWRDLWDTLGGESDGA